MREREPGALPRVRSGSTHPPTLRSADVLDAQRRPCRRPAGGPPIDRPISGFRSTRAAREDPEPVDYAHRESAARPIDVRGGAVLVGAR